MSEAGQPVRRAPTKSDAVGTAFLAAIGAVALVMGLGYGMFGDGGQVGPGFLPSVAGAFIVVASAAELLRMYVAADRIRAAAAQERPAGDERDTFGRTANERTFAVTQVFGIVFAALLLVPVAGLLLSLAAMVLVITVWVERKPVLPAVLCTAGSLGLAYAVFVQFLGVPVPTGTLGLL
ncbi:tripartite tricarboxylate transporter TctB family protein [Phytoactinopolyspora endophytica]|uniref:tripartite tricarboxylate transporter TctB family protein n=1 Tax=Phytoactinopolyspora endophytica TaxID=1642495 RepID=UPI0013EC3951|nr:tripartite tricarboxylate transporter TctB family protein [Phytoactinopolyspora endophytica]